VGGIGTLLTAAVIAARVPALRHHRRSAEGHFIGVVGRTSVIGTAAQSVQARQLGETIE
jgi:hypothetical protein